LNTFVVFLFIEHKSEEDVNIYWQLLNYGQQFFSSDT